MFLAIVPALLGSRVMLSGLGSFKFNRSRHTGPLSVGTVMITGANRGIGLEFVKQLVQLPVPPQVLIATCRSPESAKDLQDVAKRFPVVKVVKLDVEKDEDIESAFHQSKALLGNRGLNLLINNAGIYDKTDGTLPHQTRQMMQRHFNVNVTGQLMVTQKFLPLIKQAASESRASGLNCSRAGIIMITSHMGSQKITYKDGAGEAYHYKCSKTATTMAAVMMSRDLKEYGIFVAAIHPGWVRTDMGSSYAPLLPEDSVKGILHVLSAAGEGQHGRMISYEGEKLPY